MERDKGKAGRKRVRTELRERQIDETGLIHFCRESRQQLRMYTFWHLGIRYFLVEQNNAYEKSINSITNVWG